MSFGATSVAAEESTVDEVPVGTCIPAVAQPSQTVVCRWTLPTEPTASVVAELTDRATPVSEPCTVRGSVIECRNLDADGDATIQRVDLIVDGERRRSAAQFTIDRSAQNPRLSLDGGRQPVVFVGQPRQVQIELTGRIDRDVWLLVEPRIGEPSAIRAGGPESVAADISVEITPLEPGEHRLRLCLGPSRDDCTPQPGHWLVQAVDADLTSLIGPTTAQADRINMIVAIAGAGAVDDLPRSTIVQMLGLDGPVPIDESGAATVIEQAIDLEYGPFAIGPLDTSIHRFNVWLLDSVVLDPLAEIPTPTGWANVTSTMLLLDRSNSLGSSAGRAEIPTEPGTPPTFAGSIITVDPVAPLRAADTIAHEWGHSVFGLADEYSANDNAPTAGPNCIADPDQAARQWRDLLDTDDPFSHRYLADLQAAGLEPAEDIADLTRARVVQGGCRSLSDATVFRPSIDSLMNSQIPVFGPVNRAEVEAVLSRYTGSRPYLGFDDVTVDCRAGSGSVSCLLELPAAVEAPIEPFVLRAEGSEARCEPVGSGLSATFQCPPIDADSIDVVELVNGSERVALDEPSSDEGAPNDRTVVWLIGLAGAVAAGAVVLWLVIRRSGRS